MFFIASKILNGLVNPTVWIILCLLIGLMLRSEKKRKRFLSMGIIMLLVFTNPFIVNCLLQWWEIPGIKSSSINEPYDVGIVLGGSMRYYNSETERVVYGSSVDRVLQAIQLYHEKKIKKILLSGGSGYVVFKDWKEAAWLGNVLEKSCVPKEDIILENESRNTYENASFSTALLKSGKYGNRFLLITSATHIRRSLKCFQHAGLKVFPYAVDERSGKGIYTPDKIIVPDSENLSSWDVLIHEWAGMLTYTLAGYI